MTRKNVSMAGKHIVWVLLVVFFIAITYPLAFADSGEEVISKKHQLSLCVGYNDYGDNDGIIWCGNIMWQLWRIPPRIWILSVGISGSYFGNEPSNWLEERTYRWAAHPTIRLTYGVNKLMPFINVGPGIYIPKSGKTQLGFKGGLGFDYQISNRLMIEIGGDYHYVFQKNGDIRGKNTDFFSVQGGLALIL